MLTMYVNLIYYLYFLPLQHQRCSRFRTETGSVLGDDGGGSVDGVDAAQNQKHHPQFDQPDGGQTAGGEPEGRTEQLENVSR